MTGDAVFRSPHWAAVAGIVVVLGVFFLFAYGLLVMQQREGDLEQTKNLWSQQLALVGRFTTENLLKHKAQDVEQLLYDWALQHPNIIRLRAVAANGFVVIDYHRSPSEGRALPLEEIVAVDEQRLMTITVDFDLGVVDRRTRLLARALMIVTLIFVGLLGVLLWLAIRHLALIPLERSRQALVESESRYRNLVELSPDAICVHRQGRVLFVNPAARVLFGCTPHHVLVGRNIAEWIDLADRQILTSALRVSGASETGPRSRRRPADPARWHANRFRADGDAHCLRWHGGRAMCLP